MATPAGPHTVGAGPVVLDIGSTVGAAVVSAANRYESQEIEYRPSGAAWDGRHVAFHRRRLPGGTTVVAAVLPGLSAGSWEARVRGTATGPFSFEVVGGRVTTVRL
jgi:hypothetical protein